MRIDNGQTDSFTLGQCMLIFEMMFWIQRKTPLETKIIYKHYHIRSTLLRPTIQFYIHLYSSPFLPLTHLYIIGVLTMKSVNRRIIVRSASLFVSALLLFSLSAERCLWVTTHVGLISACLVQAFDWPHVV